MSPDRNPQFADDYLDIQVSPDQERDDMRAYVDELAERLPRYARRAAALKPEEVGSVEWSKAVGQYWRGAREARNISRYGLAARMNTHVNNIRFLELGIVEIEELDGFLEPYSQALGDPDLFEGYRKTFIVPGSTPSATPL